MCGACVPAQTMSSRFIGSIQATMPRASSGAAAQRATAEFLFDYDRRSGKGPLGIAFADARGKG